MWGDLYAYLLAVFSYWKWAVTGGPFLLDNIVKRVAPEWMKRLDTMVPPPIRTKYEIRIMLLAVFLAGFLAWRDEHHARLEVETAKSNVPVQSERVSRDPDGIYQYGNLQLLTSRRGLWSRDAWDRQAFEGEADCVDGAD
jgi:hypothetical protein